MTSQKALQRETPARLENDLPTRVLDSLNASIAVVDQDGTILATNDAWRAFAKENRGDATSTGVGANYLDVCKSATGVDVAYAEQAWQGIKDVLERRNNVFTLEYPCHSPREKRWFLLHVAPLKDDPSKVVTVHLKITDQKLIENQLVESARLAAIGQAMKGLSHKGRNSLQHAQGFIDLLRCSVENDPEAVELLNRIERSQRRLISLYEEVQRYAAPIRLRYSAVRLNRLASDVWHSLEGLGQRMSLHQAKTRFDLTCELDRNLIGDALAAIYDNAMSSEPAASRIEITYRAERFDGRHAITMIISDDGPGINPKDIEHVFEPFYTTKTIGTGLGLAMARRVVEAHGGRLVIGEPKLGGASVYLTVPVTRPGHLGKRSNIDTGRSLDS